MFYYSLKPGSVKIIRSKI